MMTDININPEIVCAMIAKIREFQAQEEVITPEINPNPSDDYDWSQVLADHEDDLTYQELQQNINDLEPDQEYTLVALLLIGRGDFDGSELEEAIEEAKNIEEDHVATFLLSVPLAPDYLQEGLDQFGYSCDE